MNREVGQILKEHREKRGFTLNEVASHLKISAKVLVALEEGQADRLPAPPFVRGFIKSYCQLLKIDSVEILKKLSPEVSRENSPTTLPQPEEKVSLPEKSTPPSEKILG